MIISKANHDKFSKIHKKILKNSKIILFFQIFIFFETFLMQLNVGLEEQVAHQPGQPGPENQPGWPTRPAVDQPQ